MMEMEIKKKLKNVVAKCLCKPTCIKMVVEIKMAKASTPKLYQVPLQTPHLAEVIDGDVPGEQSAHSKPVLFT
jgi:hypothetical protein